MTHDDMRRCAARAREIEDIYRRLECTRALAEFGGLKSVVINGFGSPLTDGTGEGGTILADIEREFGSKLLEFLSSLQDMEAAIAMIKNPDWRTVMRLRYVDGLTWGEIEKRTNYTKDGLMWINQKTLKIILREKTTPHHT